jgi:guanylate kinase
MDEFSKLEERVKKRAVEEYAVFEQRIEKRKRETRSGDL